MEKNYQMDPYIGEVADDADWKARLEFRKKLKLGRPQTFEEYAHTLASAYCDKSSTVGVLDAIKELCTSWLKKCLMYMKNCHDKDNRWKDEALHRLYAIVLLIRGGYHADLIRFLWNHYFQKEPLAGTYADESGPD